MGVRKRERAEQIKEAKKEAQNAEENSNKLRDDFMSDLQSYRDDK